MTDPDPLARPVWNMLNGRRAGITVASGTAVRLDRRYGPFAATSDTSVASQKALADVLDGPGDEVWLIEEQEWPAPPGTRIAKTVGLVQMVFEGDLGQCLTDPEAVLLEEADQPSMESLALATEPGPWGSMTHRYGPYYGFKMDDRLQSMAGERMLPAPGLAEVSGVCTWPEWRGRRFATRLIHHVMAKFSERGDRAFLHTYATNTGAIGLYETLGYRLRRDLVVTVVEAL